MKNIAMRSFVVVLRNPASVVCLSAAKVRPSQTITVMRPPFPRIPTR